MVLTFNEHLLCFNYFICISSFNVYNCPVRWVPLLSSFYGGGNRFREIRQPVGYSESLTCLSNSVFRSHFIKDYKIHLVHGHQALGFPEGSAVKNPPVSVGDMGSIPGLGRSPWRRKWQLTPVFLLGKSHGQGTLAGYVYGVTKRVRHDLATKQQTTNQALEKQNRKK